MEVAPVVVGRTRMLNMLFLNVMLLVKRGLILSQLPWRIVSGWDESTEAWARELHRNLHETDFQLAILLPWGLWSDRNSRLMENLVQPPLEIVLSCQRLLNCYADAQLSLRPAFI
ncbi:UNVERIFIED_CONTAM: hypothetical protein Slati_1729100 [Sesamum latifolium]|uniref:Uncharacterized protein n=1 Tax=Sesamum latifolium TaxID=2727402 RepID=A0AAW2X026_9LAMI